MTTPIAPFAALSAAGLSYERLVAIFKLVQERATSANASDILDFLKEDLSSEKFSHLTPEQRARLQVSLRALQEYALEVWRSNAVASSGVFPMPSPSGSFQAVSVTTNNGSIRTPVVQMPVQQNIQPTRMPSGGFPVVSPSGSWPIVALTPSGSFPVVQLTQSGAFSVASQPSGSFQAVPKKASLGERIRSAFRSLFGKNSKPQLPNLSLDVTNAMLAPGE